MYLMKIQINFLYAKKFRYVFNENTDKFLMHKKISDLYLVKIQISFFCRKIFKTVFNENSNLF